MTDLKTAIAALKEAPKVSIKGKQYSQVATRVEVFRDHFGLDYSLETEVLDAPDPLVRVRATIRDNAGRVVATGLAEEDRSQGMINKTSALENCETSAIGRALAAFGLHGGEYATANEVQTAIAQQNTPPAADTPPPSGKHTKTSARKAMMELSRLIHSDDETPDEQTLDAHIRDHHELISQVMRDWPSWWHGEPGVGDGKGAEDRIQERRDVLRQREAEGIKPETQAAE